MSSTQGGIISLNFGGCGVRLGASTTRLYAEDFGIGMDGSIASNRMREGYYYDVFFSEQKGSSDQDNKKFLSRSLYFDSDPDSLDSITGMAGLIPELCKPVWADGLGANHAHTYTKDDIDHQSELPQVEESVRHYVEGLDKLQGFWFKQSASGHFGSQVSRRTSELFNDWYPKHHVVLSTVLPDTAAGAQHSTEMLQAARHMVDTYRYGSANFVYQNSALQNLYRKDVGLLHPTFEDLNRLILFVESRHQYGMTFDSAGPYQNLEDLSNHAFKKTDFKLIEAQVSILDSCILNQLKSPEMSVPQAFETVSNRWLTDFGGSTNPLVCKRVIITSGEDLRPKEVGQQAFYKIRERTRFCNLEEAGFNFALDYSDASPWLKGSAFSLPRRHAVVISNTDRAVRYLRLLKKECSQPGLPEISPTLAEQISDIIEAYSAMGVPPEDDNQDWY